VYAEIRDKFQQVFAVEEISFESIDKTHDAPRGFMIAFCNSFFPYRRGQVVSWAYIEKDMTQPFETAKSGCCGTD
jgi:hypothetical protein